MRGSGVRVTQSAPFFCLHGYRFLSVVFLCLNRFKIKVNLTVREGLSFCLFFLDTSKEILKRRIKQKQCNRTCYLQNIICAKFLGLRKSKKGCNHYDCNPIMRDVCIDYCAGKKSLTYESKFFASLSDQPKI